MPDDHLIREVRQVRGASARKLNDDVDAMIRDLMARQREICEGHVLVRDVNEFERESKSRKTAVPT